MVLFKEIQFEVFRDTWKMSFSAFHVLEKKKLHASNQSLSLTHT